MSYKEKPIIKLYKFENNSFVMQAQIDDFQEVSFEHNIYEAGTFTITINYNIPNALLFQRGLFVQFGNNPYDFGEIYSIQDAIGQDGKGSQIRTITGRDARYILKRRVIKNMNSNGLWAMTDKGEIVLRNLIKDQCGSSAEAKRQLPISNTIPASADAKGKVYSVSENFTNLYEVCKTIATQSEIGWRMSFDGTSFRLKFFRGRTYRRQYDLTRITKALQTGNFPTVQESYSNAIYIGGKGQNDNRDIYEGEDGTPKGLDRFESWDNQSSLTVESEYEAEALSMLTQYGQTLTMSGNGLAKCPYVFREQYDIGDTVTVAFSGKSAKAQILSITEHWTWGSYDISFAFGKPQNNLADQLQLMLRKIQEASNKTNSTDSVRWYTIPTDTAMPKADVTYNTIGFVGTCASGGSTFTLYLDNEKTGAKTYHVYFKQLGGTGKLTLTTGKAGATDLVLNAGTYVAIIYVDENGNITNTASTPTATIEAGSTQPATSGGVSSAIENVPFSSFAKMPQNANLNDYRESGKIYTQYSSAIINTFTNKPSFVGSGEMAMFYIYLDSPNYGIQFYIEKLSTKYAISERVYTNGSWSGCSKTLQDTDPIMPTIDAGKTDANNCYDTGTKVSFYRLPTNSSNVPVSGDFFTIQTYTYNDGTYYRITQIATENGGDSKNQMYIRRGYGTNTITWGSWERLLKASDLGVENNDEVLLDITTSVTLYLGANIVKARRKNNIVYLYISGTYTGNPSNSTQLFIEGLPQKYRPKQDIEGLALLGYNATQYATVARSRIGTNGNVSMLETSWANGTAIRCGLIYFVD